ncbi:hypothetical protein ABK040_014649 [Willaertia magna]
MNKLILQNKLFNFDNFNFKINTNDTLLIGDFNYNVVYRFNKDFKLIQQYENKSGFTTKIKTTNEATSIGFIEATQPIFVHGSSSTAALNTSVNYLSEKLQIVYDKPKLQTIKKPLRKAVGKNRKPKTTNTNLVTSLDKLEAEVTVDIPSEEKFSQLEQEAKKIEPVQEEKSKILKGGVSMFGGLPMGMGGNMMGELAAKLKKKQ